MNPFDPPLENSHKSKGKCGDSQYGRMEDREEI
jgi:hypothetical protein